MSRAAPTRRRSDRPGPAESSDRACSPAGWRRSPSAHVDEMDVASERVRVPYVRRRDGAGRRLLRRRSLLDPGLIEEVRRLLLAVVRRRRRADPCRDQADLPRSDVYAPPLTGFGPASGFVPLGPGSVLAGLAAARFAAARRRRPLPDPCALRFMAGPAAVVALGCGAGARLVAGAFLATGARATVGLRHRAPPLARWSARSRVYGPGTPRPLPWNRGQGFARLARTCDVSTDAG